MKKIKNIFNSRIMPRRLDVGYKIDTETGERRPVLIHWTETVIDGEKVHVANVRPM